MSDKISVVIVGAAGGIGQRLCELVASREGAAYLIGRKSDSLSILAQRYGWGFSAIDASSWEELDRAFSAAEGVLGSVQSAVCLAGSVLLKPAHLTSLTELNETIHANLLTAFGVVRCAAPRMFGSGGSIVLMSSAAAHIGLSNHEAIAMCKSGIDGLVKSAAATYASRKICVNAIAPGLVRTPLTERIWNNARAAESSTSLHPLGRLGEPSDVAEAIGWLIDPKQTWITGQSIGVDGGLGSLKTMAARPAG